MVDVIFPLFTLFFRVLFLVFSTCVLKGFFIMKTEERKSENIYTQRDITHARVNVYTRVETRTHTLKPSSCAAVQLRNTKERNAVL